MGKSLLIGKSKELEISLNLAYANRHGLITGATGTGKTVTLQALAEHFSESGVPVLLSDIKGDLVGLAVAGGDNSKIIERNRELGIGEVEPKGYPVTLWDVFGENGTPLRATVSDLGPLLLSKLLDLNATQQAVVSLMFAVADDNALPILNLLDLRAMLRFVSKNSSELSEHYGNVAPATVSAIQRAVLVLEEQGGDSFFGEPMLDTDDLFQCSPDGRGYINILCANKLFLAPQLYSAVLLWLLSELYENLPEVGDLEKPKLAIFFDEAHLLFEGTSKALNEKIELVVRLIRSKGVAVFFVTQNPVDLPEDVLGQLGNRVHHALRAFSPKDQKAVRAAAQTLPTNPNLDSEQAIVDLAVGEALVSFLDEEGSPTQVERVFIVPPRSHIGTVSKAVHADLIAKSPQETKYRESLDSQSAYEILKQRTTTQEEVSANAEIEGSSDSSNGASHQARQSNTKRPKLGEIIKTEHNSASTRTTSGKRTADDDFATVSLTSIFGSLLMSTLRSMSYTFGRLIVRGIMGTIVGTKKRF